MSIEDINQKIENHNAKIQKLQQDIRRLEAERYHLRYDQQKKT